MLRIFKITFAIFIIGLMLDVSSCRTCGPFPDLYKLTAMKVSTRMINTSNGYNYVVRELHAGDSSRSENFAVGLTFENEQYYSAIRMDWGNVAYACKPAPPSTLERITDIRLITDRDYDAQHPAGSNIADICYITTYTNDGRDSVMLLSDYLAPQPSAPNYGLEIRLAEKPAQAGVYSFKIEYHQNGVTNNYFEGTTEPIIIY